MPPLIAVMSVMNGFRRPNCSIAFWALNGHAVVQGYGGPAGKLAAGDADTKALPGVIQALPLIEQPLMGSVGGPGRKA